MCNMKKLIIIAGFLAICITANAWSYYFDAVYSWIRVQAYPRSGGLIKVDIPNDGWDKGHFLYTDAPPPNQCIFFSTLYSEEDSWPSGIYKEQVTWETEWGDSIDIKLLSASGNSSTDSIKAVLSPGYSGVLNDSPYPYDGHVCYRVYAEPNEGYHFVGLSRSTCLENFRANSHSYNVTITDDMFVFDKSIAQTEHNPGWLFIPDSQYWMYSAISFGGWDISSDATERSWALFSRVIVNGDESICGISNNTNEIGEEITIIAVDGTDEGLFSYWIEESTGRHITENPYTFTVSRKDSYTPVFGNPAGIETPENAPVENTPTSIYTIDGKQLQKEPTEGIYIKNGKKVLVK